ncbi:uncharacterized protein LOC102083088 [Oreochromis niloticus]|uniref:uncharacterized protein LOC102083088 n=1 Tax=Oreochromis niloticus TaxID=8128 RepID=UPI0009058C91|nr:uncharacterized protein LOC102083088 [Oreochromis niloticus]
MCGEPGPSGITHTTRLQNSTPPHNDQDTIRSQTFLECLRSIDLPERQKPGASCNSGESEPIFISGPATTPSEWLPRDFSDVFEYSISDFDLVHIPTTPECARNNVDSHIDFEEDGITDSQISAAYDAYMKVPDAQPAEQSHIASKNDILSLIDAKLTQHQQAVQRDVQEIAVKFNQFQQVVQVGLQEIAAKLNQHQEAAQGDLHEIAGGLTSTQQAINSTWGLLDLISTHFLNR